MTFRSVLLALALAGCLAPAASTGEDDTAGEVSGGAALALVEVAPRTPGAQRAPEAPGGEPMLAVAPGGALYLQTTGNAQGALANAFFRSDDDGASWTRLAMPPEATDDAYDGAVAAGPDGVIYAANARSAVLLVFRSDDRGETWSRVQSVALPAAHRMWLAPSEGRLDVGIDTLGGPNFHYAVEGDGADPAPVVPTPVAPNYDVGGSLARRAADGALLWPRHETSPVDRWVAYRSADGGATWSASEIALGVQAPLGTSRTERATVWAPTAFDDAGSAFFAWADVRDGVAVVNVVRSLDAGATWSAPFAASLPDRTAALPWLAARGDGDLALAWYEADEAAHPREVAGTWTAAVARMTWTANESAPTAVERLTLDGAALAEGPICADGQGCPSPERAVLDYVGVAHGARGIVAAFAREGDGPYPSEPVAYAETL